MYVFWYIWYLKSVNYMSSCASGIDIIKILFRK